MRSARRLIGSLALLLVLGIQGLAAAETPSDLSGAVTPSLVQLTWTPQLGTPFVVFRRAPSAAITSLSSGTAYGIGAVVGSSTCVGLPVVANLVDSGLAPATAYAYDVFASAAGNTYTACATIAVATAALPTPALTAITPSISPPQPISGVVITGTQIITPTSFWPGDALAFGANGYESVYTFQHQDNWEEAETEAEQAGGFLATVDSAAMDPFFLSFPQFEEDDLAYIGLWDPSGTGTFQWVDGEPLTYTEWYDPQTTSGPYVVMGGGPSCAVPSTIWDQANNSDIAFTSFFEFPAPGPVLPGVVLRRPGQADIPATAVAEGSGQALTCSFDLTGALDGLWDVVLTDAFGEVTTLPNAFLVHTAPVAGPLTCLQFDGIQDVGGTPLTAALAVGTQETIEGWFKTTSTANAGLFMNLASEPNANGLVASLQQGQVAGVADLGGWQTVSPPTVVNDGQWHHVACIMDGESVTTVLDGVPAGPAFGSALLAGAGQPSGILFGDGLYGFFQGELADMRCWDAALPVGVISAWRGARVTPAHPYAAHLLAEYRCDDGSGDTASDSAHGITATLYNAPQWQPGLVFFAGTEGQPLTGTLTGSDADNDPLTYSVLQEPSSGTVVLDPASGDFTYTPAAGVFGFDRFTYQVDDGLAASAPTQVNLFLAEVGSAAPIADAASVTVISNATANGTLQASDAAGIALTYAIASQPSHGSVVLLNPYSGAYSYTSAANYVGPDAVTFTASDGVTLSAPATIAITVRDQAIASPDSLVVTDGTTASGQLQATDSASQALTFAIATGPTQGVAAIVDAARGTFTYTPAPGAVGADAFTFTASDSSGASAPATVAISIVAQAPIAAPASLASRETSSYVLLTWSRQPQVAFTVFRRAPGTLSTVPAAGTSYAAGTSLGSSLCLGQPQVANLLDTAVAPGTSYVYDVVAQTAGYQYSAVSTLEATTAPISSPGLAGISPSFSAPQLVTGVVISGSGLEPTNSIWPAGAEAGTVDGFAATAAPQGWASAESAAEAAGGFLAAPQSSADSAVLIGLGAGAPAWFGLWDPNGIDDFAWVAGQPLGSTDWAAGQPQALGSDRFGVFNDDGTWSTAGSASTYPALVEYPGPAPLAPTVVLRRSGQADISASAVTVLSDASLSCSVDLSSAAHGRWDVVVTAADGGTATLPGAFIVDQPPVSGPVSCLRFDGVSASATTATTAQLAINGQATLECWFRSTQSVDAGAFVSELAPVPGQYQWTQGLGMSMSFGQVISGVNIGGSWHETYPTPTAADGAWHHLADVIDNGTTTSYLDGVATTTLGTNVPYVVSASDLVLGYLTYRGNYYAGDLAEVRAWSAALPPAVISAWSGARVDPTHPYYPYLQADFRCDDGSGTAAVDTVQGLAAVFSGAPQWQTGLMFVSGLQDTVLTGTLIGAQADQEPLTYQVLSQPASGTLSVVPATGAFTYTPAQGFVGSDAFTYEVGDGLLWSSPTQVNIHLEQGALVAWPGILACTGGQSAQGTLQAADRDALPVSYAIATSPANGTVIITDAATGAYTYTPDADFVGADAFTFTASDGVDTSDPATISITVAAPPAPVALNGVLVDASLTATAGTFTATPSPGLPTTFAIASPPQSGTVSQSSPGSAGFTYTPHAGANGMDSFTFTASDGFTTSALATITVTAIPQGWQGLGSGGGANGRVLASIAAGTDLYISGNFTAVGGVAANGVARFDGTAWHALGSGLNGQGNQLAMIQGILYVSGHFSSAGGVSAANVASWNGTTWSALGAGVPNVPESATVYNGQFVVGGGVPPWVMAWNGTTWTTLGTGTGGWVYSLLPYQGGLVASGDLDTLGGVSGGIAFFNGSQWSSLGGGLASIVAGLGSDGVTLYAVGNFTSPSRVAQWNGTSWSGLAGGFDQAAGGGICCGDGLTFFGDAFTTAGGLATGNTAIWTGSAWSEMGGGTDGEIFTLTRTAQGVVVGGLFGHAGGMPYSDLVLYPVPWSDGGATSGSTDPTITGMTPSTITTGAGTTVVITGTNLLGLSATIGGLPAATLSCSETTASIRMPDCPPGPATVQVTTQTGNLQPPALVIAPAALVQPTLTWSPPASIAYGTPLGSTQLDAAATAPGMSPSGGAFTYAPAAGSILGVGSQVLSVTFTPSQAGFATVTGTVTVQVTPAPLLIQCADATMVQGGAVPTLSCVATGLIAGDALTGATVTTTATSASPVGTYPITASQPLFLTSTAADYAIQYLPGTLSVTSTAAVPGAPVISGVFAVAGQVDQSFAYQIEASGSPTAYTATALPPGLSLDPTTGLIAGTPTMVGVTSVVVTATNALGSGTATLTIGISSSASSGGCGAGGMAGLLVVSLLLYRRRTTAR